MDDYTNESVDMFLKGIEDGFAEDTKPAEASDGPVTEAADADADAQTAEDTKPAESEEAKPDAEAEEKPQTITIEYDGQQRELTLEEAVTLSQKGMNYDRMVQRYEDQIQNGREAQVLSFFAEMYGKTKDEYVEYLWGQRESAIAQKEADALRRQYPDAPESLIEQMSAERARLRAAEMEKTASERKKQSEEAQLRPWYEFAKAYPEEAKDLKSLPRDVLEAVKGGEHPISAMRAHQLKAAQQEVETLKTQLEQARKTEAQNQKNRKSAIGSAGSTASEPVSDPFLDVLNSD